jgi:hypothetical protein
MNPTSSQVSEIRALTSNGSCVHEDAICVPTFYQGILGTSAIYLQAEKASVRIREQWFAMVEFEKSCLLSDIYLYVQGCSTSSSRKPQQHS